MRAESLWRVLGFVATIGYAQFTFDERAQGSARLIFPRRVRDSAGHAVHGAISRHRAWLRVHAVSGDHSGDVHCHRCRYERAISTFERAARVAALFAKARALDAARETIHGLPAIGDAALSAICGRRATRLGRSDLGELFPPCY